MEPHSTPSKNALDIGCREIIACVQQAAGMFLRHLVGEAIPKIEGGRVHALPPLLGLNLDIDDPVYARMGRSKGKRLRCFLQTVNKPTVVRTLKALWEYREPLRQRSDQADKIQNAHDRLLALINRLEGRTENAPSAGQTTPPAFDRSKLAQIKNDFDSAYRCPVARAE